MLQRVKEGVLATALPVEVNERSSILCSFLDAGMNRERRFARIGISVSCTHGIATNDLQFPKYLWSKRPCCYGKLSDSGADPCPEEILQVTLAVPDCSHPNPKGTDANSNLYQK